MRILITSPTYPPANSGLGNSVAIQANQLALAKHAVTVATGGSCRLSEVDHVGISIETFAIHGAASIAQPISGDVDSYIEFLASRKWDVILLNAWQNWATDLAIEYIKKNPCNAYLYSHGISTNTFFIQQPIRSVLRYLAWRIYWLRLPKVISQLSGIIFLANGGSDSRFDDLRLTKKLNAPTYIIPNSISPQAQKKILAPVNIFKNRDRIIAVGSYQWQKGFDFVLRAYAASKFKNIIPLYFYGQKFTSYTSKLISLSQSLGLNLGYIFFCEGVSGDELIAEYQQAYLVLSGSLSECQPLALVDASSTGTPFIARATGCISGMPGGIAVDGWRAMAENINYLISDEIKWHSYSCEARAAAKNIYDPGQNFLKLMDVLSKHVNYEINSPK